MRLLRGITGLGGAALFAFVAAMGPAGCAVEPSGVVYVRMAPPPPEMEAIGVSPGGGYVWIAGHHAWRGDVYVWVPGRWERPPHEHGRWLPGRWEHNRHGWFWVEGRWK